MKGERKSDAVLLSAAIAATRDLDLDVTVEPRRATAGVRDDLTVSVEREGKKNRYHVELKSGMRRELVGPIALAFSGRTKDRLLVTDYVSAPLADELRQREVQFIDTAGNAFIRRPGLLVIVTGRRPPDRPAATRTLRVFRPSGLRTIFALLSLPRLVTAPQREIARAAGVALGSVSRVLDGLRELGFVGKVDGDLRLLQREQLLRQWTEGYIRLIDRTLEIGRFSSPSDSWWRQADLTPHSAQWGGETAAALLQRHLVPERAIVYAAELPHALLSKHRLKADPAGRVVLRRRFWNFNVQDFRPDVVPPLLVYADLVAGGDSRSITAAEAIRDEYLD